MRSYIFFMVLILNLAWGHAAVVHSKIVYQMETGFNLTQDAAQIILSKVQMKSSQRKDFYADLYDGQQLLFDVSVENYKFRLKSQDKKWVVQANTTQRSHLRQCSENLKFDIREKNIGELDLTQSEALKFENSVSSQIDLFRIGDSQKVLQSINNFQKYLLGLKVPLLNKLLSVSPNQTWVFVATHSSQKTKWKGQLAGNKDIEISITESKVYQGSTFLQVTYEVEFQVAQEGLVSVEDFSNSICEFMDQLHFSEQQLDPQRIDPQAEILKLLSPLRDEILPKF